MLEELELVVSVHVDWDGIKFASLGKSWAKTKGDVPGNGVYG